MNDELKLEYVAPILNVMLFEKNDIFTGDIITISGPLGDDGSWENNDADGWT